MISYQQSILPQGYHLLKNLLTNTMQPKAQQLFCCQSCSEKGRGWALPISPCCHYTFFEIHVFACALKEN